MNHCPLSVNYSTAPMSVTTIYIMILVHLTSNRSPEFLLYNGGRPAVLPPLPTFFVAAVVLLDQHRSSSALLEFFLLIITSEFALDKNGSLRHLFVKCILQRKQREAEAFQ